MNLRKALRTFAANQEALLLALIAVLLVIVFLASPSFFHIETLFNVIRESMVSLVFGIGVLIVLISGGIDVSFLAIGIFSAYLVVRIVPADTTIPAIVLFLASIAIGAVLGLVNVAVVLWARVITLIATLATSAIFTGVLFAFIGGSVIADIPTPLREIGRTFLITAPGANRGQTNLSVLVIPVILVAVLVWWFLRNTTQGRAIYAIGGDEEASRRTGLPVVRTRIVVFVLAGALAGFAGMLHVSLSGRADPTTFTGGELDIIAAVILGGALITGGKGSVRGAVLGVLAIATINASLIPLGVPPIWQKAVVGALLLVGVGLQALSGRVKPTRPILAPDDPALNPDLVVTR